MIGDPWADTPVDSPHWQEMTPLERVQVVQEALQAWPSQTTVYRCDARGRVTVAIVQQDIADKGHCLMRIEALLQENVDPGLCVYLHARPDESKLRGFRGVA